MTPDEIVSVLANMKLGHEIEAERNGLLIKNAVTAEKVLEAVREPRMLGCYTDFALSNEEALSLIIRYGGLHKGVDG